MDLKEQTSFKFIKASCVNEGTDEIQLMEHEDRAQSLLGCQVLKTINKVSTFKM